MVKDYATSVEAAAFLFSAIFFYFLRMLTHLYNPLSWLLLQSWKRMHRAKAYPATEVELQQWILSSTGNFLWKKNLSF